MAKPNVKYILYTICRQWTGGDVMKCFVTFKGEWEWLWWTTVMVSTHIGLHKYFCITSCILPHIPLQVTTYSVKGSNKHNNQCFNPLNPELNPICYLLALLAHHFLHVSRIRVKSLTLRLLMSYIYVEHLFLMFLDHTQRRSTVGRTPLDE